MRDTICEVGKRGQKQFQACPHIRMEKIRGAMQRVFREVKQVLNQRPIFQDSTTSKILIFEEFLSS
jgi:hypothetical protein